MFNWELYFVYISVQLQTEKWWISKKCEYIYYPFVDMPLIVKAKNDV